MAGHQRLRRPLRSEADVPPHPRQDQTAAGE
jgi:hypothetical protein